MSDAVTSIIVLISGNGSNLQAIIDAIESNQLNVTIACVISNNPNAYGLERAQKHHIPIHVIAPIKNETRESYDRRLIDSIEQYTAKLIVLAGFMRILGAYFVQRYHGKLINIHPSLLPKYPGLKTHEKVIANGDDIHGCTIHYVTEAVDSGAVIAQAKLIVGKNETASQLKSRVHALEHTLYPEVIQQLCQSK
ncbi:MAG: phosphoribosylglycinamide formyltransferase [Legionellales bacterium]|nr:phosphoribosylglycinamide formyltransferase [Legionellales bacterium]